MTKTVAQKNENTEQKIKLEWPYKFGSECELNSWPGGSLGQSI